MVGEEGWGGRWKRKQWWEKNAVLLDQLFQVMPGDGCPSAELDAVLL